ncbi:MAG: O-antigen ligase family protein, partial [Candidatus Paceibacterales bacterium]
MVEIMAVFYLLLLWEDSSYRPRLNKISWSFIAFTGAFTLATILSANHYDSFWGTLERMGGLWTFWHYLVFFIIAISVLKTRESWMRLLQLTVFVGFLSAIYGFGQKTDISFFIGSGEISRIFGTIGNAALFAGYQILNLFLALTLAMNEKGNTTARKLYVGAALINTIAVLMTAVRGSLMAVGVGFILIALLYGQAYKSKLAKKILLGLIVLAVLFVLFANIAKNTQFVKNSGYLMRVTDFSLQAYTVQTRVWAWQAGLTGWKETPKTVLFGWGPENFNIPFSKYFNPEFYRGTGSETFFDRAHNMFVEVLVTMGLVGLLAYLSVFWSVFRFLGNKLKERKEDYIFAVGFIPLTVAYIIHNFFIFDTSANYIVFF